MGTEDDAFPDSVERQCGWLIAALRNEPHAGSFDRREAFARKLEWALLGTPEDLRARLARVLRSRDAVLLARLARWHEDVALALDAGPEQASHRWRAQRYREIADVMRLWV